MGARHGRFYHYTEKDGLPRLDTFYVSSFAQDPSGALWIGFSGDGGLVRYRDGRFTLFTTSDGVPPGQIRNLFVDSAGRLWVPTYRGGLSRIDDTTAERPQLVTYTTAEGLSSNEVTTVTEDRWGRIYIGTGRGLDRLDPATGRVKHYTTADGLPLGEMAASFRDRRGALWFSFSTGLVRLVPELDPPPVPPPVLITGLHIAGEPHTVSALGETEVAPMELDADRNELQIEFVGLGFSPGEGLRYQYRLEGASEAWSTPSQQRTVNFANLAPSRYRFLARAVNADGVMSERAASFSFTILPPVWQRWWFIAIVAVLIGLIANAVHRYRVARLVELERVRTRIAADLHDDIGSGLSRVAILSEVVKRQIGDVGELSLPMLSEIADSARRLVDSMSDIVWSTDPRRDDLSSLVLRVRQFGADLLEAKGIAWDLQFEPGLDNIKLAPDLRRHLFLIFKEAINNIGRHADCRSASLSINVAPHQLQAEIWDDGRGFQCDGVQAYRKSRGGHGLENMQRRAAELGGELRIDSLPGQGTRLRLKLPL